jgi:hypothetical protein
MLKPASVVKEAGFVFDLCVALFCGVVGEEFLGGD